MTSDRKNKSRDSYDSASRVLELADSLIEQTASSDEIAELETLMSNDPNRRRLFLRYMMVHGQLALTTEGLPQTGLTPPPDVASLISDPRATSESTSQSGETFTFDNRWLIPVAVAATLLVVVTETIRFTRSSQPLGGSVATTAAHYDNRNLPILVVGFLETDRNTDLSPTTLTVDRETTRLTTTEGTEVQIDGPALFGASSQSEGVLFQGSVRASVTRPGTHYSIQAGGLRVVHRGSDFRVATISSDRIWIDVTDGEVEVQSRVRRPLYHWGFDGNDAKDVSQLRVIGDHVLQSPGLVGSGALRFDNQNNAVVRIDTGMGSEVGTGEMACSSGISIEALIVSQWSGREMDYDEIFRKEDGNHRMLLSLQNDGESNDFDVPDVPPGPCLSFGLHLQQHGYSELDMPLDGKEGRPTLAELTDGQPHHIVATYDSFTGRKAIYVDGQMRFSHVFPIGKLILNGGPTPAEIGNHVHCEPFTGTIDEVAYYNFALTADEIAAHHDLAKLGQPYFPTDVDPSDRRQWRPVTLVRAGHPQTFNTVTGLAVQ